MALAASRERLAAFPALTARRLLRELKERDFPGSYSVVRDRVREIRPAQISGYEVRSRRRRANKPKSTLPSSTSSSPMSPASGASSGSSPWCSATPG